MKLQQLDHVALAVTDLARSTAWYREVLGLERRYENVWGEVPTMMAAGDTLVALFPMESQPPKPAPGNDTIAMRHFAFRATREQFEQAQEELRARGIKFRREDHTISHSIYFRDPDGHLIEVTTYEVEHAP